MHMILPLRGRELSGQPDKDMKDYILTLFPDFLSKHTYKFTPQEDTSTRDAKKMHEEAARTLDKPSDDEAVEPALSRPEAR
jgi:transcription initiation factor TFIID subunit 8